MLVLVKLFFQSVDMSGHAAKLLRYGIGKMYLIQIEPGDPHAVALYHPRRYADCRTVRRYFGQYHRVGGYLGIISYLYRTEHPRARADHDVIAERGVALSDILAGTAQGNTLIDSTVVAYLGSFTYHYAAAVVYKQALSYLSAGVYLYTGLAQRTLGYPPCYEIMLFLVPFMGAAIRSYRLKARIEKIYLHAAFYGGIALLYRLYVGFYFIEHTHSFNAAVFINKKPPPYIGAKANISRFHFVFRQYRLLFLNAENAQ